MPHDNQVPDFLTPLPKTTRTVTLPSRGVLYKRGPAKEGKLTLAAMTLVEENLLQTPRTPTGEDGINAALRKCIQETIDINSLLAADKFFLFLLLRAITYGSEYTFNWTCNAILQSGPRMGDNCGWQNRSTVRIPDEFQIKQLDDNDTEPFMITLPESGKDIGFRLPRVGDEQIAEAYFGEQTSKVTKTGGAEIHRGAGDTLEARQLVNLLTHVDGNELGPKIDRKLVMRWFLSLPSKDIAMYRQKLDFFTPGIETEIHLTCAACGHDHEMDMPITAEFFRPEFALAGEPAANEVRPDAAPEARVSGTVPDPAGGTPLVLREIEGAPDGGSGVQEDGNRVANAGGGHRVGQAAADPVRTREFTDNGE